MITTRVEGGVKAARKWDYDTLPHTLVVYKTPGKKQRYDYGMFSASAHLESDVGTAVGTNTALSCGISHSDL
jgi:hypothetical protein